MNTQDELTSVIEAAEQINAGQKYTASTEALKCRICAWYGIHGVELESEKVVERYSIWNPEKLIK